MLKQFASEILSLGEIARDYYLLKFRWNSDEIPEAGQFLTIRVTDLGSPLLRRPFAFSEYDKSEGTGSVIFQKVGKGTEILSSKRAGNSLDILGPLGNSFQRILTKEDKAKSRHIVVAGGIGIGPMLYLFDELKKSGKKTELVMGCRDKSLVPFPVLGEMKGLTICTDDGSHGFHGNVVDYLRTLNSAKEDSVIYSCGPHAMLKGCQTFAEDKGISSYVSLEEMMACGVGACMGCTCEKKGEKNFARVCKDGPVFPGGEIKWI